MAEIPMQPPAAPQLLLDIDISEVEKKKKISSGPNGDIWQGTCRRSDVVIKEIRLRRELSEAEIQRLKEEVRLIRQITVHPNLVLQLGVCFSNNTAHIVMVQMMNDLETLLMDIKEPIPVLKKIMMAKDAAQGILWLHGSNIIHKNIKLKNLLVDKSLRVCVSDYWFPTPPADRVDRYTPPQLGDYTERSDAYSFGICLHEIMSGQRAYSKFTSSFYSDLVCNGTRPSIGENIPPLVSQLMQKCWAQRPEDRPPFHEIIQHLNEAIVQEAIPVDKAGRTFWLKYFADKTEVSWDAFQTAFSDFGKSYIESKDMSIYWRCLQSLLITTAVGKTEQGIVEMERFGKILSLFGPMADIEKFFQLIEAILKQKWFHGDMGFSECEAKLSSKKSAGTYLVRFSSREVCYVVSSLSNNEIIHRRIFYKHGEGFWFENKCYKSLADLIRTEKRTYGWKHSVTGSKYYNIFPYQPKPKSSTKPKYPNNYATGKKL